MLAPSCGWAVGENGTILGYGPWRACLPLVLAG